MYMGRKTEAEIRKDGYYKYPNIVSKYYMEKPVGYINGTSSREEIRNKNIIRWFRCNHVAYYEGMLGNGYIDVDTKKVLGACIDIPFRNLTFTLEVFNHRAFLADTGGGSNQFGFLISCKLPDEKHMVFTTNKHLMKYSPVSKPRYTFNRNFLRFLLEHDRQEYGKFHAQARRCALQMLNNIEQNERSL